MDDEKGSRAHRKWSNEEIRYLEESWGNISVNGIAKHLRRSENAVIVKKERLGIGAFLENGDYIVFNQLVCALGFGKNSSGYKMISRVKNRGFPIHRKRVNNRTFKIVYLEEWWKWADQNRNFLDFSKFEENALGMEPEWAKEKRKRDVEEKRKYTTKPWTAAEESRLKYLLSKQKYTYMELSVMIGRSEGAIQRKVCDLGIKDRPVKADNHTKWTKQEYEMLGEMIKAGFSYKMMSEKLGKSVKAISGRVYAMYLTQELDKVRKLIGTGNFGDNRPEHRLKHWYLMNTEERTEARDLMIRLTAILQHEFIL